MAKPSHDPSIEHEPHLTDAFFEPDPSEQRAELTLDRERSKATHHDSVEHTVWDEPALSPHLAGEAQEHDVTYSTWLRQQEELTDWNKSLGVMIAVAAAAGPFAILGALMSNGSVNAANFSQILVIAVVAPVSEEIAKIAATLWVVEKRPYWFKSTGQILLCAAAGGVIFGVIENLIYLYVYIPDAGPGLARWRWTVCIALHTSCSFVAGLGCARIWSHTHRTAERPNLTNGVGWFVAAMIGHGVYNFSVTVAESLGLLDFAE